MSALVLPARTGEYAMTFQMDTTALVNLVMKELTVKKVCKISEVLFSLFLFLFINSLSFDIVISFFI